VHRFIPWLAHALKKLAVVIVPLLTGEVRIARYCSKVAVPCIEGWSKISSIFEIFDGLP
jgi:hypothetical protein